MTTPMVYSGDRAIPLADVRNRSSRLAAGLRELGVAHGDRYAIVMRNEVEFLTASLAAAAIGAVPVPVNWHWTGEDLRHLLHDSGAKVIIAHSDLLESIERHKPQSATVLEAVPPPEVVEAYGLSDGGLSGRHRSVNELIEGNEPVTDVNTTPPLGVIYTSGTTGLAKGIQRAAVSPDDAAMLAQGVTEMIALRPEWRTILPAPLYHSAPNFALLFAAQLGMDMHIMPRFDPEGFLRLIDEFKVDTVQMVPTMFRRLLALPEDVRASYDLSSLKAIVHAAAPCPPDLKKAMIDWVGPIVHEYYGGSEGGAWVMCDSAEALAHPGTVGRPMRDADIKILGPDGAEVPAGESGLIYGRPFTGWPDFTYIGNDEKRRSIEVDGYITVGDIGHVDTDGYLYLSDRANDMVIQGGVNVYPAEVEASIFRIPGVSDVAVFGIPDVDLGEVLAAHLVIEDGAAITAESVREHVRSDLAKYKVPRVVVFEESLPREDSGKLFKRRLREKYWREAEASS